MRRFVAAFALIALAGCAAHTPPSAVQWTSVDAATGRLTAVADLEALASSFPESAGVQLRLLNAAHRAGDSARVRAAMIRLSEMGYALSPGALEELGRRLDGPEAASLAARAAADRGEIGGSELVTTVPADFRLVEGLAWDPHGRRLFASSIVSRQLLVQGPEGWSAVPGIDAGSLSGLAVDAPRGLLWMASGVVEPTPSPETAFRGLIAVSLDNLRVVRRVTVTDAGLSPGDIGVAADGTVYASDPMSGAILRLLAGAEAIEILVPPGRLRSPQGIAVVSDRSRLYVPDYNYGIAIVDLPSGRLSRLAADAPMMLNGIDGLLLFEGDLIGIQNGTNPRRIVRIRLDRSGTRATGLEVIERNHRDWGEPTLAQLREGRLIYVADAQWERFGAGGQVSGAEPLRPTAIRAVPLR